MSKYLTIVIKYADNDEIPVIGSAQMLGGTVTSVVRHGIIDSQACLVCGEPDGHNGLPCPRTRVTAANATGGSSTMPPRSAIKGTIEDLLSW